MSVNKMTNKEKAEYEFISGLLLCIVAGADFHAVDLFYKNSFPFNVHFIIVL